MSLLALTVELTPVQVTDAISQYLSRLGFSVTKCAFKSSKNYDMHDREAGGTSFTGATVTVTQTRTHTMPHGGDRD